MAWPRRIYVATASLGVYYTDDFSDPAVQPTWTAVNTGLAATACREFWLDPFDPLNKQYVLLEASRELYRRDNMGNWATILTDAQLDALTGRDTTIYSFCVDPSIDGRLRVLYWAAWNGVNSYFATAYSNDYGDTWTLTNVLYISGFAYTRGLENIRTRGNNIFCGMSGAAGGTDTVAYSTDGGVNWTRITIQVINHAPNIKYNQLLPNQCYADADPTGNVDLWRVTNAGVSAMLQDGIDSLTRWDNMWFDPGNANHQRIIDNSRVYVTTDEWTTINAPAAIAPVPISFAPWAGDDTDQMLVSLTLGGAQDHVIGTLYGEGDVVATGIAGTNCGVAPYTNSIPETCGGVAQMGIQAIDEALYPPRVRGSNPYRETIKSHHQQLGVSIYASEPVWRI